jgi:hypothetical protein
MSVANNTIAIMSGVGQRLRIIEEKEPVGRDVCACL